MIRIGIMLPRLGRYGGVEQFGYRMAEYLAGLPGPEFQVTFVCARQDDPAPQGVRVIRVGRPLPGKLGKTLWFALAAEAVRRREKFDVTVGLGNTVFQDLLRLSGAPTPIFWDCSIAAYPPGLPRMSKTLARRLSPGKQLARIIEKLQAKHSKMLVANSDLVRDLSVQAFPFLDPEQIPIIYNEPDLTRFHPGGEGAKVRARTAFHLPAQADLILTAGTNFRLKGVHVLLEALAELPASFHLAVAGGREELLNQARQCGVQDRVHFLGRVDDMPKLYHAADIFVLNTFYDACSNAVLEALACGLPVLSTTRNGSSAFLRPEAVLPDPTDVPELVRRIQALIHGGSTARPDFSPPRGLAPYAEIIRGLARAKMNPPATNTTTLLQNRKMP
jgi:UDP-glucose:(heptosyl)LPS alpha-1,3-glucosyltransferase